jgi:hypothetical protein
VSKSSMSVASCELHIPILYITPNIRNSSNLNVEECIAVTFRQG